MASEQIETACGLCAHEGLFSDDGTVPCKKPVRTQASTHKLPADTHADDFTACGCKCVFPPERIWLPRKDAPYNPNAVFYGSKDNEDDVEYIRADLVATAIATERASPETKICDAVQIAMGQYRCTYFVDADDLQSGLHLVDVFTPEGCSSIKTGEEELEMLIDFVCGAIVDVFKSAAAIRNQSGETK